MPLSTITRRQTLRLVAALPVMAALGRSSLAASAPLKIAFIGAGRMGSALGTLLVHAGHEVMFSSRHPEELTSLVDGLGARAHAGTVADAVKFGDVVFLTVPYSAMPDLAKDYGKTLAAKPLVIDVGNPIPNRDGAIGTIASEQGAGLYLSSLMPGAKLVRAFNALNWAKLPEYATRTGENKVAAPMVGDDPKAVGLAESLIREMGFEPVMIGGLALSKYTMPREALGDDHTAAEARKIAAGLK
jgi:8-hydroxy-5-deazaflavin:NADPH oxidoreductase